MNTLLPSPALFVLAVSFLGVTNTPALTPSEISFFENNVRPLLDSKCYSCHSARAEKVKGGLRLDFREDVLKGGNNGPDLTGVSGRFSHRDLLESLIDPSKEVSDQYAAVEVRTLSGRVVVGRIVNLNNDTIQINTDMLNPGGTTGVNRNDIESMKQSKVSMMPAGLLDTMKEDEVLDLMAYMLSRGDRKNAMFKK